MKQKQQQKHIRAKRLTRKQKIFISKNATRLNVANWSLLEETPGAYILVHKRSGKTKVVYKNASKGAKL